MELSLVITNQITRNILQKVNYYECQMSKILKVSFMLTMSDIRISHFCSSHKLPCKEVWNVFHACQP